jgi:RNase P protein component
MTTRRAERVEEIHAMGRLIAERKFAAIARRRARAAVGETASRLKDEVAKQVAQIDDDRAYAVRPTFQIPPNWKCTHLNAPTEFYKVVACVNERFVSVYDGATEYELGRWYQTKRGSTWPPLDQCFFAFSAPLGALEAAFPRGSKAKHAPRVLLKIEAVGNAYECHETKRKGMASKWTGKVAVTRFRVSRIMTDAFRESALDTLRFGQNDLLSEPRGTQVGAAA